MKRLLFLLVLSPSLVQGQTDPRLVKLANGGTGTNVSTVTQTEKNTWNEKANGSTTISVNGANPQPLSANVNLVIPTGSSTITDAQTGISYTVGSTGGRLFLIPNLTRVAQPTLTAAKASTTSATVTYGSVTGATEYVVEYSESEDFPAADRTVAYKGPSASTITVSGLNTGTTYFFRVTAWASGFLPSNARIAYMSTGTTRTITPGSGDIDGSGWAAGDLALVSGGSTSQFNVVNVTGTDDRRTYVIATGVVDITGFLNVNTCAYTTVTGRNYNDTTAYNLYVHDIAGSNATELIASRYSITLQNIRYVNIGQNSIAIPNSQAGTTYNGTDATTTALNHRYLHIEFQNAGGINMNGSVTSTINTGYSKNTEIAYCYYHDRPDAGEPFSSGNILYNIHHNVVDNVNTTNDNHNGIFHLNGTGVFHSNRISNHEGNALRAWPFVQGTGQHPTLAVYNNIVINSRKYGGFEFQEEGGTAAAIIAAGKGDYVNIDYSHNTVGNTNSVGTFSGQAVDLYNVTGVITMYNNVLFNPKNGASTGASVVAGRIYSAQGTFTVLDANYQGNRVYSSMQQAGIANLTDLTLLPDSPLKRQGIYHAVLKDYFSTVRSNPPSIGATE